MGRGKGILRACALGVAWLGGCATESGNLAPAESLEPAGWLDVERGGYERPWMLIQSMDDSTTVPAGNQSFVLENAGDPRSRVLNCFTDPPPDDASDGGDANVRWLSGTSASYRVNGLSHLAVHVAPDNPHYGSSGDYRHCGDVDGRDANEARRCQEADSVDFADWSRLPAPGRKPTAISSFNPRFDELAAALGEFLDALDG